MYLKSIDIQGFKSFPDKLHLEFHKGMTAIVGPNGSGKSNIADAIRWVLGEQSTKALRGSKMEDVIFAGTQSRRSVGYAEVSLTLDNSQHTLKTDYTEVMVTRRYYRSGESEYFINKKTVRLKDIHELFMDTGLGRDGYSIIGQGRIDEILSVKSDDRREVFDEAAGITKFRYRRDEATKRLNAANDNLVRVNDIIETLEQQIEPLRIKAEKERRYNTLFGELKGLEITLWMNRLDELKVELDRLTGKHNLIAYACEECTTQIESAHATREMLSEKMIELERTHDELRSNIRDTESQSGEVSAEIGLKNAEIARNCEDMERLRGESRDYEQRKTAIVETIAEREAEIEQLTQEIENLRKEIETSINTGATFASQISQIDGRLYSERESMLKCRERIAQCRIAMSSVLASVDALNSQLIDVGSQEEENKKTLSEAQEKVEQVSALLDEKKGMCDRLDNVMSGYRLKLDSRRKKFDEVNTRVQNITRQIDEQTSRLKILSDLERDYEGFNRSVKMVMRDASAHALNGIHGPVSKLMKVDDRYVVAAETALGAGMQNIVVDREEDAKAAIEMLKRRDAGRATFLPIAAIKGTELEGQQLRNERGFVGILSQLVSYDTMYSGIFRNLLGRTAVCDSIDSAIALARKNSYKFRIVTLDGQVINAGGAMTGGSQNKSYGILSRTNEIERLTATLAENRDLALKEETALRQLEQELTAAQYSLSTAENERRTLDTEVAALEAQLTQRREHLSLMEQSFRNADALCTDLRNRIDTLTAQLEVHKKTEAELVSEEQTFVDSIEKLNAELETLSAQSRDSQLEIDKRRAVQQETELKRSGARSAVTELKLHLESVSVDKETRNASADAFELRNATLRTEVEELTARLKTVDDLLIELEEKSRTLTEQKLQTEAERNKNERLIQDLNDKSKNLATEQLRFENSIATVTRDQDNLTGKLWDTYELTRSTARELCIELENSKEATKRADELRRSIKALGNISPGAIEEYAQVSEKYGFLTAQREDIIVSQKSLNAIIDELTGEMKTLFSAQFKVINEIFSETFTELFGGGRAHLELSDPDDVLGSGIEIKVQPPGKALKVLSLLSGGEKAFVAIALYFAILKVRPTPFCVLDEIEAALDDVNVLRYARYLKRFTDTQFIVITHRRGTMEEADVLYGVAMPVQGISKVLSLDIGSVEKELNLKL